MSNEKFTPGPWRAYSDVNGRFHVCAGGADDLASLWHPGRNPGTMEANARLIAAAPDMLNALMEISDAWYNLDGSDYQKIEAAIKKALGDDK